MSEEITFRIPETDSSLEKTSTDESIPDNEKTINEEYRTPLVCDVCNIKVTSSKILQRHLEGRRHKMRVERRGKTFRCELCDVNANSETQLNIHMNSTKHKARLQRKDLGLFGYLLSSKGLWLSLFCILCICLNLFILLKVIL